MDNAEFERRKSVALAAIRRAQGTKQGEDSIDMFLEHHLEELPRSYWQEQLATTAPNSEAVIGLLVCRSSWGENDLEHFDFTLPGDVTDYVVSARFDKNGEIDSISMES